MHPLLFILRLIRVLLPALLTAVTFAVCEGRQVYSTSECISLADCSFDLFPQALSSKVEQAQAYAEQVELTGQERRSSDQADREREAEESKTRREVTVEKKHPRKSNKEEAAKSPQRQASTQQVNHARELLERGKIDSAIRTLEKAVKIDTRNGEAFILLARAWRQKGEKRKALEFAKKAELLCQKQPARLKEVYLLESDIYREMGESADTAHKPR